MSDIIHIDIINRLKESQLRYDNQLIRDLGEIIQQMQVDNDNKESNKESINRENN
jgi:hypothetical protein